MRKHLLLLTGIGIGIGAGVLYVLRGNPGRNGDSSVGPGQKTSNGGRSVRDNLTLHSGSSLGRLDDVVLEGLENEIEPTIDDRGTRQYEASGILRNIRDGAFDSSDEKLALALGRPTEEIEEWTNGTGIIDGDVVMKARALALLRGIEIE